MSFFIVTQENYALVFNGVVNAVTGTATRLTVITNVDVPSTLSGIDE
jgi:hypothetical protein